MLHAVSTAIGAYQEVTTTKESVIFRIQKSTGGWLPHFRVFNAKEVYEALTTLKPEMNGRMVAIGKFELGTVEEVRDGLAPEFASTTTV